MLDQVGGAYRIADDTRQAAVERLWDDEAEACLDGWQGENIGCAERLGKLLLRDCAEVFWLGATFVIGKVLFALGRVSSVKVKLEIRIIDFIDRIE